MYLVIVHRYVKPDRFGLLTNAPHPTAALKDGVFWAIGLFNVGQLIDRLMKDYYDIQLKEPEIVDVEDLIKCAPIEWHSAMRDGDEEVLDRFKVFEIIPEQDDDLSIPQFLLNDMASRN